MVFKNFLLIFICFLFSFFVLVKSYAKEAKIIKAVGRVSINGVPAKVGDIIPLGAKVETASGGAATIAVDEENIMKVSSESVLKLEESQGGASGAGVQAVLEKGRVEGVKKILPTSSSATRVETTSGTLEITGGRYLIEQPENPQRGETVFLAVDGNAKITSNSQTVLGGASGAVQGISLSRGDMVSIKTQAMKEDQRTVAVVTQQVNLPPEQVKLVMPPIVSQAQPVRSVASVIQPQSASAPMKEEKVSFRDALPPSASTINQDPLQPITPPTTVKNPRVSVKFNY